MRVMKDKLESDFHDHKEEITTLLLALQKQNFILGNSLTNLVHKWNTIEEEAMMFGILLENKA